MDLSPSARQYSWERCIHAAMQPLLACRSPILPAVNQFILFCSERPVSSCRHSETMVGKGKASGHHLASRVKKIMQKDEDVGKIAQATPVLICRAMELLLKRICEKTFEIATNRQAKTVNASHVKNCVMSEETLDFLKDTVAAAPDLAPEEVQAPKAAPKRRRNTAAAADDSEDQGASSPRDKPKRARAPGGGRKKEQKQQEEGAQDGDTAAPAPAKRRSRKKVQPDDSKPDGPQEDTAAASKDSMKPGDIPAADVDLADEPGHDQEGMDVEPEGASTGRLDHAASTSGVDTQPEGTDFDAAGIPGDQAEAGLPAAHSIIAPPAIPATVQLAADVDDDYDDDYDDEA